MQSIHPILLKGGFVTETKPVADVLALLRAHIEQGEECMVCYAPPRAGKSSLIRCLEQRFRGEGLHVVLSAMVQENPEERPDIALLRSLLEEVPATRRFPVLNAKLAVLNHMRNACDQLGTPRVVIVLDEAQHLEVGELAALKEIADKASRFGISVFVLLIGQPLIVTAAARFKLISRHDLVDRFFTVTHRMPGLVRGTTENFLQKYDDTKWPENSNVSFVAHFAPGLWNRGWRATQLAAPMWHEFNVLAAELGHDLARLEIGVKYVAKAMRTTLLQLQKSPNLLAESQFIRAMVRKSNYKESSQVVGDAERDAWSAFKASPRPRRQKAR